VDEKYALIVKEKEEILAHNQTFLMNLRAEYDEFVSKTGIEIQKKSDLMQQLIVDEMKVYNSNLHKTVDKADKSSEIVGDLERRYEAEYVSFFKERKKWKSDFQTATEKAVNNFQSIEDIVARTLSENATNTKALKMVLDAIMIDQLILRQDVEDRKDMTVMGIKQGNEQESA